MTEPTVGKIIANFLLNDIKAALKQKKLSITECPVSPQALGFLARRVEDGSLDKRTAKKLLQDWLND